MAKMELFQFDLDNNKVVQECSLHPTDVSQDKVRWLYAGNNKYDDSKIDSSKVGKWMIFPSISEVNSVWDKIKDAVKNGHLWHSKVSTKKPMDSEHAIMIYTKDFTDIDDVIEVLDFLESSGIKHETKVIYYKPDEMTLAGIYSNTKTGGRQRASLYSSNTIRVKRGPY